MDYLLIPARQLCILEWRPRLFREGAEIITPALTFSTTVGCIVKNNLVPVFVDVGKNNYCIDVNQIESVISKNTVAILAPNLMGNLCDYRIDKIHSG